MPERFLTVDDISLSSSSNKKKGMIKTYSFTTDDEDTITVVNSKEISNSDQTLAINSSSNDGITKGDASGESDTKITKRKSRRRTDSEDTTERKNSSTKKHSSYQRIDWSKPIIVIGMLIFIYFMWLKKDIWIPRLLSSNGRIRRLANIKDREISNDISESSSYSVTAATTTLLTDSSSKNSQEEDEEQEEENESDENTDESTSTLTKSKKDKKMNVNIRRTKVKFNQEDQKKKHRHSKDRLVEKTDEIKPNKSEETTPSLNYSLAKQEQRSIIPTKSPKKSTPFNSNITLITYNDIVNQLRSNLRSRIRNRKFLSTILKTTGLNKKQFYRFVYRSDHQFLTLSTLISLLDTFNLMLLISPK